MAALKPTEFVSMYYELTNALDVGTPSSEKIADRLISARNAARVLSRISEQECNGIMRNGYATWTDEDQQRADQRRDAAEKRFSDALGALFDAETFKRIDIEFQGDPRGPSVLVHIKDGPQRVMVAW